ncbi:DUF1735 domain-containing protein [Pedobacter agri]|uniref:DUF1735 domain-containing protein n=1 Tax=Pedobacter agri TaxID=454586 RepID=UPI00278B9301|nr:DUF1735 domain-containing protein [Pedobacter agri]MDQ1140738.1 hypothetical protein [Pedobacter agri]
MKKYIFKSLTFLLAASTLTSCLKDDTMILDPAKGHNVIEFANPAQIAVNGTPSPMYQFSYSTATLPTLPITVSYSGPEATAPQDITVRITPGNTAKIQEYNTATSSSYTLLPAESYTLSTNEVVIKAGTSKATFNVALRPLTFSFTGLQVLPLTISSVSTGIISGNFGTILLNVTPKNIYDGVYNVTAGNVQRFTAPGVPTVNDGLNGDVAGNPDVSLQTINLTTVQINGLTWHGGGGIAGIDNLRATIDPATNLVTMSALGNASLRNIAGTVNRYDPATKTLTLNFEWNPTANRRAFTGLVFKYNHER